MEKENRREEDGIISRNRRHKTWKKIVSALGCVVVFCTTYALILPAITMEETTYCAIEAHEHTDECYEKKLICGFGEEEESGHTHTDACYTEEKTLICGQEETQSTVHTHSEDCYAEEKTLVCGQEEAPGHTHTESCIAREQVLICTDESEGHEHTEACYETTEHIICGIEEGAPTGHVHTDACYATEKVLRCGHEEGEVIPGHTHTEDCYRTEKVLSCGQEETKSGEADAHEHTDECYEKILICEKEEHVHTLSCYSNPEADVETAAVWERAMAEVELQGNWRHDVIAIAQSQLGYTESSRNYAVTEDGAIKGYTRYGAWYGDEYGDWCAMFVSFCLHYAGVPEESFPPEASCERWVETLKSEKYDLFHWKEDYTPQEGDVVFFDGDGDWSADHVGLVAEYVCDAQGAISGIKTIEGNNGEQVTCAEYTIDDARILGYGEIPEQPTAEQAEAEEQKTLCYAGEGYVVSISYGEEAGLPEGVELRAEEYAHDCDTFRARFEEAAAYYGWPESEENNFRLFNIGLYLDGEEVEPQAEVQVSIRYTDGGEREYQVVHFTEQPEAVEAVSDFTDGEQTLAFAAEGFSDYGIMPLADSTHPQGPVTADFPISGTNLYSIGTSDGVAGAVAGVTYTVYRDGAEVNSFTTAGGDFSMELPGLSAGNYTIRQTQVPSGYVLVPQEKTFTVADGKWNSAGIFYVYDADDYELGKNAQVHDYENRIYEEVLTGKSGGYDASIDAGNFVFVVDRSNSMLFPTTLTPVTNRWTGRDLTVDFTSGSAANNFNMETAIANAAGADADNGLYYIINDPNGTATVYALWKKGSTWYHLDASYYVKAQAGMEGVQFPDAGGSSGGALNSAKLTGSFPLYRGSPYTRLTWLKYDLSLIIYQLAALNPNNTVTLTTFDSDVRRCITRTLDDGGVNDLIASVTEIATSGGTAQDKGLLHVVGSYYPDVQTEPAGECTSAHSHLSTDGKKNYVVLITDGALNSKDILNGKTPEQNVRAAAEIIRGSGKMMTIGLSMDNVTSAQSLLCAVSNGGIATDGWNFLDRSAKDIASTVQNKIWGDLVTLEEKDSRATVKDYVSESFYLVTADGAPLKENDWITQDGAKTTPDAWNAAGQIGKDENGWYVQWEDQTFLTGSLWSGKLFVKAKEDFIGGNAIEVNKAAEVDFLNGTSVSATVSLETPTVNVRLLPMESFEGEATVFLGDKVNRDENNNAIPDVIEDLTGRLDFRKLVTSSDPVCNKEGATEDNGCREDSFTVSYATQATGGALTAEEWEKLKNGETVSFPYTYDAASSGHAPVGYFSLQLIVDKDKVCTECGEHFCDHVGEGVLSYQLKMSYTAYRLGEGPEGSDAKRPTENAHNGTNGPGTEVGSVTTTLESGKGVTEGTASYEVNVVDGKITLTKELEEAAEEDTVFTFKLFCQTTEGEVVQQTPYAVGTILIPAGSTEGTQTHVYLYKQDDAAGEPTEDETMQTSDGRLTFLHLARGSYAVQESQDGIYAVKEASVTQEGTNCTFYVNTAKSAVTFHIGYHPTEEGEADNIVYETGITEDGHHIIYSSEWQHIEPSDPVTEYHGESYGTAHFLNTVKTEERKIPVRKLWDASTGGAQAHSGETVYIALYYEGQPVIAEEMGQLLKLDAENNWSGEFTIRLPVTEEAALQEYSIREVSGVSAEESAEGIKAVVVNDEARTTLYYKEAAGNHKIAQVDGKSYLVSYGGDVTNGLTAMNEKAFELPKSGGAGTGGYTMAGLLTIAGALCLMYYKKKHGKEEHASS